MKNQPPLFDPVCVVLGVTQIKSWATGLFDELKYWKSNKQVSPTPKWEDTCGLLVFSKTRSVTPTVTQCHASPI